MLDKYFNKFTNLTNLEDQDKLKRYLHENLVEYNNFSEVYVLLMTLKLLKNMATSVDKKSNLSNKIVGFGKNVVKNYIKQ